MSGICVEDIAWVHLRAPDLDRMEMFGRDFGLVPIQRAADALYLGGLTRDVPYLHKTSRGDAGLVGLGFRASEADVHRLGTSTGIPIVQLEEPGGGIGVTLHDPDGFQITVVANQTATAPLEIPLRSPTNDAHENRDRRPGAKSILPGPAHVVRLGHCVLHARDLATSEEWYKSHLGLLTSHEVVDKDGELGPAGRRLGAFLRCNRGTQKSDHHTLVLLGAAQPGLHHAAFEVLDFDDLMAGHEHLKRAQRRPQWGVGRHLLGSQIFDYWYDPFGHVVEHWTDGDRFDEAWGAHGATLHDLVAVQWGPTIPDEMMP